MITDEGVARLADIRGRLEEARDNRLRIRGARESDARRRINSTRVEQNETVETTLPRSREL
jgi:hypothetical protein